MVSTRVTQNASQIPVNICGSSVFARYNKISAERTYNMFMSSSGDDKEKWMINFPGYHRVLNVFPYPNPYPTTPPLLPSQVPVGSGRGAYNSTRGGFSIIVVNSGVYRISPALGSTLIGNLNTSSGEVFIAENLSQQICIVDGSFTYIYYYGGGSAPNLTVQNLANGLPASDPLVTGDLIPNYVEYHNTYFLFGNKNTTGNGAAWYAYSFASNTTINAVLPSFLALSTKADTAVAVKRVPGRGNNVLVFGNTVTELWTQVGGQQNYIRNQSVNINYGCLSVSTIGEGGDLIAWLAANEDESPVIMVYDGNSAQRISSDGIDYLLEKVVAPQTSTAILYRLDGHLFYQLTFYDPRDNFTLLYDFNTKMFFNLSDQYYNYHPARAIIYFNLNTYFLSLNNAALYQMSSDFTTIDENLYPLSPTNLPNQGLVFEIPRMRITGNVREANGTRFIANSFVMTLEQGADTQYTGISSTQNYHIITEETFTPPLTDTITEDQRYYIVASNVPGSNNPYFNPNIGYTPHIDLSVSKDGGITWSQNVRRNLHTLGNRQNTLHWESMGVANDLCFRFEFHSNYRWVTANGLVDIIS